MGVGCFPYAQIVPELQHTASHYVSVFLAFTMVFCVQLMYFATQPFIAHKHAMRYDFSTQSVCKGTANH